MLDLRVESRSFASGAFLCGKVFLVRVGDSGEATFRRAFYDPGARTLLLVADSPHWKPVSIYVSSPEHLQHTLLARVVWCGNPML